MHVMMRLPSTKKREYVNLSPSNGSTMIRSCRERGWGEVGEEVS